MCKKNANLNQNLFQFLPERILNHNYSSFKIGQSNVTEIALHYTGFNAVYNVRIYTLIMSCGSNCSDTNIRTIRNCQN